MYENVSLLMRQDQQRSDRYIAYTQHKGTPLEGTMEQAYDVYTKELDPEYLKDLSNAVTIADGIYTQMGVELGL